MKVRRRNTPFDGRKNNWLEFARAQAEFYRNADQYIINLKYDLREINKKIEEVLKITEDEECNMKEGYRIYQTLKDLRAKRREKFEELQCIQILTDYFDCEDMRFNCEENLAEIEEIMAEGENESEPDKIMMFGRRAG